MVRIIGTGSSVAESLTDNETIFRWVGPTSPTGEALSPDWITKYFGIQSRSLDLNWADPSRPQKGPLFDSDFAVRAAQNALEQAAVKAREVDSVIQVTCTPDSFHYMNHMASLWRRLGLRRDAHAIHFDLGCAGLASAFVSAESELRRLGPGGKVLLVASQCISSSVAIPEVFDRYKKPELSPWAWLVPVVFGDGGGALVLTWDDQSESGILKTEYELDPDLFLVHCPSGGAGDPLHHGNLNRYVHVMDAPTVGKKFVPIMEKCFEKLEKEGEKRGIQARDEVHRWYFHQANAMKVREAAETLELPRDRVPLNVDRYGNTSAASTLILLDEDRRAGRIRSGDLAGFLWVGAGVGAQYGYSLVRM